MLRSRTRQAEKKKENRKKHAQPFRKRLVIRAKLDEATAEQEQLRIRSNKHMRKATEETQRRKEAERAQNDAAKQVKALRKTVEELSDDRANKDAIIKTLRANVTNSASDEKLFQLRQLKASVKAGNTSGLCGLSEFPSDPVEFFAHAAQYDKPLGELGE